LVIAARPPEIELRCDECGRWIKWLSRSDAELFSPTALAQEKKNPPPPLFVVPQPPAKPAPILKTAHADEPRAVETPAVCDHREELDRLIAHLGGIERELATIVRAMINGAQQMKDRG